MSNIAVLLQKKSDLIHSMYGIFNTLFGKKKIPNVGNLVYNLSRVYDYSYSYNWCCNPTLWGHHLVSNYEYTRKKKHDM
jgi:hypothetical protein